VPPDQELATALDLAESIAAHPQPTVGSDREAVYGGLGRPIDEGLEIERRIGLSVLDTAAEGAARFAAGEGRHGEA
jgi:enoyl-CoA hydratase/carnithine racemase